MPGDFSEPWEPEDIFDRAEAADRRARIEAAKERNAAASAQEAVQEAARREAGKAFSLEANERIRMAEYRRAGVSPPVIGGVPVKTSLPLLLSFGWTIGEVFGERALIRPPQEPQYKRKTRADYDQNT
jgi:hypothetical protein